MSQFLRISEWQFDTAATGGIGIEILSASGGSIILADPIKQRHSFSYSGFGLGFISFPIPKVKLPPVPILNRTIEVTGAAKSFDGGGILFMTESFHGKELSKADLQGGTVYLDGGTGLLAGYGGSVMLLGLTLPTWHLGCSIQGWAQIWPQMPLNRHPLYWLCVDKLKACSRAFLA